jgi:hypothetical protein
MRSQTQYFLHVDPTSSSRRVALLGDQTLADLHALVSDSVDRSNKASFQFNVASRNRPTDTRFDELDLCVGQTFDYVIDSNVRQILVEAIDN